MRTALFAVVLLLVPPTRADDDPPILNYDARPPLKQAPQFDRDNALSVSDNDFEMLDYQLMSSEQGERWAVVTLRNTASGQRLLSEKMLLAEFANGERRYPLVMEGKVAGGAVLTRTVTFGYSRFPVLRLIDASAGRR